MKNSSADWPIVIVESPFAPNKDAEATHAAKIRAMEIMHTAYFQGIEMDLWRQTQLENNKSYALDCCADCIKRKEVPFASHAFFPQFLNEFNSIEREIGLTAGYAMWRGASRIAFYLDNGWSPGMLRAKARALQLDLPIEERFIKQDQTP